MDSRIDNTEFHYTLGTQAAGTGTHAGSAVDLRGKDGVKHVASIGTITATSVVTLKQQHSADGSTGWADSYDETGAQIKVTIPETASNKVAVLEMHNPNPDTPFVRPVLVIATANCAVNSITSESYAAKKQKISQNSNVVTPAFFNGCFAS